MLTHKNSNFLFYNFNIYLIRIDEPTQSVSHTIILDDNIALKNLQEKDWTYFIERLNQISQKESSFELYTNFDENKIVLDTIENLVLCKVFHSIM